MILISGAIFYISIHLFIFHLFWVKSLSPVILLLFLITEDTPFPVMALISVLRVLAAI